VTGIGGYSKAFTTPITLRVVAATPATKLVFLAPVPAFFLDLRLEGV